MPEFCRAEAPAATVGSVKRSSFGVMSVIQAALAVPTHTQGVETPDVGQDDEVGTVMPGHKLRVVTGTPGELNICQIKGMEDPGLYRFSSLSDTGDWNPTKDEKVVPVAIASAPGSNAVTQQEPVPLPPPFSGSPLVTEGAV